MHEESVLINSARRGDRKALRDLYEGNMPRLFRFMRQFSADTLEVEDWVQRAFIKSFENIGKFNGLSRYSTWLISIAVNEMKMDIRKKGRSMSIPEDGEFPADFNEDEFHWEQIMKDWLSQLSEIKRMVFILYEVEGYSHAEIAAMLDIGESTSRTILTRVKAWLRLKWKESESQL